MVFLSKVGNFLQYDIDTDSRLRSAVDYINQHVTLYDAYLPFNMIREVSLYTRQLPSATIINLVDVYKLIYGKSKVRIGSLGVRFTKSKKELVWVHYSKGRRETVNIDVGKSAQRLIHLDSLVNGKKI